jgi:NAD(P)-dependent dehydrogenase (short-subunit alcohol dehydrogenase family)
MALEIPDTWGLAGKVAIVSGGGAAGDGIGNGRAAAILLAKAGARVVVVDRDKALAQRTVAMIQEARAGEAIALDADVTQSPECGRMVQAALDTYGRLDLLDNNVGIGSRGSVVDETEENWRRVMQVNVETMFLTAKHAIPAMKRGGGGAIVNVSSISALRPRGLTTYSVSKGAVIALTQAMAVDHGRDGIRVNCVAPGPMYTPMVYARGMSEAARERRRNASLLKIEGTGWDIGHAVRFLLSDYARYITGHVLVVDGGTTVTAPERDSQ